jgi:hypothetical protein
MTDSGSACAAGHAAHNATALSALNLGAPILFPPVPHEPAPECCICPLRRKSNGNTGRIYQQDCIVRRRRIRGLRESTMMARTVIWLGLGAIVAATTFGCGCAYAQSGGQNSPAAIAPAAPQVPTALPEDVAFGRFIALIRGHLLTGDELVSQRQWSAAHPHFSFPTEEIYGVIREQLRTYRTPPFDGALKALARTVKAHNAKQFPKARQKVEDALAAADAGLKVRQPDWPRFVVQVAIAVLKTAPDEFDDAVTNGRIVRPIGYQTARGFILQADRMIESVAPELEVNNAAAFSEIRAGFAQLKQVFAVVTAPKQAMLDYPAVLGIVARIERAAGKLT